MGQVCVSMAILLSYVWLVDHFLRMVFKTIINIQKMWLLWLWSTFIELMTKRANNQEAYKENLEQLRCTYKTISAVLEINIFN